MTWRTWAAIAAIAVLLAIVVTLLSGAWRTTGAAPQGASEYITSTAVPPVVPAPALPGVPLPVIPPRTADVVPHAEPSGAIGSAIYSASATWCAPTPTQCQNWGGNARLAAVNSFRFGDEPYPVRVWRGDIYVDVTVVSFCGCHGELGYIDLSPAAFRILEPNLDVGRIDVAVEVLADLPPDPRDDRMRDEVRDLPATSTEDAA